MARNLGAVVARDPESVEPYIERVRGAFDFLGGYPDVRSMNVYGEILFGMKEIDRSLADEAIVQWERASALDPFDPVLRIHLADAYSFEDEPDRALAALEPLRRFVLDPRIDYLNGRSTDWPSRFYGASAVALMAMGNETEALELARMALDIDPKEPRSLEIIRRSNE
jgi:tetratricopeptide (TPR) repeat protein